MSVESPRPDWLKAALRHRSANVAGAERSKTSETLWPALGQLRVLRPSDLSIGDRMGLIVGIDDSVGAVSVLLLSPLIEYSTAADFMLEPDDSGFTAPLLVECDLRGSIWATQLGPCVGRLKKALAYNLDMVGAGDSPTERGLELSRFGLPARDERDPRWGWKLQEREALDRLTAGCERRLLSEEPWTVVVAASYFEELASFATLTPEALVGEEEAPDRYDAWMDFESLDALDGVMENADPDMGRLLDVFMNSAVSHLPAIAAADARQIEWLDRHVPGISLETLAAAASRPGWHDDCIIAFVGEEASETRPLTVLARDRHRIQLVSRSIEKSSEVTC